MNTYGHSLWTFAVYGVPQVRLSSGETQRLSGGGAANALLRTLTDAN